MDGMEESELLEAAAGLHGAEEIETDILGRTLGSQAVMPREREEGMSRQLGCYVCMKFGIFRW
jgi:hypothetical protein